MSTSLTSRPYTPGPEQDITGFGTAFALHAAWRRAIESPEGAALLKGEVKTVFTEASTFPRHVAEHLAALASPLDSNLNLGNLAAAAVRASDLAALGKLHGSLNLQQLAEAGPLAGSATLEVLYSAGGEVGARCLSETAGKNEEREPAPAHLVHLLRYFCPLTAPSEAGVQRDLQASWHNLEHVWQAWVAALHNPKVEPAEVRLLLSDVVWAEFGWALSKVHKAHPELHEQLHNVAQTVGYSRQRQNQPIANTSASAAAAVSEVLAALAELHPPEEMVADRVEPKNPRAAAVPAKFLGLGANFPAAFQTFLDALPPGVEDSLRMNRSELSSGPGFCLQPTSRPDLPFLTVPAENGPDQENSADCESLIPQPYQLLPGYLLSGVDNPLHGQLVTSEVGVGKTATGVFFLRRCIEDFLLADPHDAQLNQGAFDVLILVKDAHLFDVWIKELKRFYCGFGRLVGGFDKNRTLAQDAAKAWVYVVPHPLHRSTECHVVIHNFSSNLPLKQRARWAKFEVASDFLPLASPQVSLHNPKLRQKYACAPRVIVDEAHNLVDPKALPRADQRRKALLFGLYLRQARHVRVCAMTATPFPDPDNLSDLVKLLNLTAGPDHTLPADRYPEGKWLPFPTAEDKKGFREYRLAQRRLDHLELYSSMFTPEGRWLPGQAEQFKLELAGRLVFASIRFDQRLYPTVRQLTVSRTGRPEELVVNTSQRNVSTRRRFSDASLSADENAAVAQRLYGYIRPLVVRVQPSVADWKVFVKLLKQYSKDPQIAQVKTEAAYHSFSAAPKIRALKHLVDANPNVKHFCYANVGNWQAYWLGAVTSAFGGWVRDGWRWGNHGLPKHKHVVDLKLVPDGPVYEVLELVSVLRWTAFHQVSGQTKTEREKFLVNRWFEEHPAGVPRLAVYTGDIVNAAGFQDFMQASGQGNDKRLTADAKAEARHLMQDVFNDTRNLQGQYVRVLCVDPSGKEGMNTTATQYNHTLTPFEHAGDQTQVLGRNLRTCSHDIAPDPEVRFLVYLLDDPTLPPPSHASSAELAELEAADEFRAGHVSTAALASKLETSTSNLEPDPPAQPLEDPEQKMVDRAVRTAAATSTSSWSSNLESLPPTSVEVSQFFKYSLSPKFQGELDRVLRSAAVGCALTSDYMSPEGITSDCGADGSSTSGVETVPESEVHATRACLYIDAAGHLKEDSQLELTAARAAALAARYTAAGKPALELQALAKRARADAAANCSEAGGFYHPAGRSFSLLEAHTSGISS